MRFAHLPNCTFDLDDLRAVIREPNRVVFKFKNLDDGVQFVGSKTEMDEVFEAALITLKARPL